jgi:peptide chain release factor 2
LLERKKVWIRSPPSWSIFDLPAIELELTGLRKKAEATDLWDDRENALGLMKRISDKSGVVEIWHSLQKRFKDISELAEMDDENLRPELEAELVAIEKDLAEKEITALLAGPYDKGNAILTIQSGAGGTESQDWAAMLMRMYLRWIERKGYKSEIIDQAEGEEAGIKTVTISVEGLYAYGYLHAEKGVHRLVRLSPFDAAHRRHTSFAQIEVLPADVGDDQGVIINPEDIKIDVYKSSGAGGQNVQKNATAIRITHIPSGLVVSCQNERSQLQNRENAMRVLKARLLEIKEAEDEKHLAELRGEYVKTEWGSQIRSYVLHPYQLVKDHRTNFEVGNAQAVLEGDIDPFIEAYLRMKN